MWEVHPGGVAKYSEAHLQEIWACALTNPKLADSEQGADKSPGDDLTDDANKQPSDDILLKLAQKVKLSCRTLQNLSGGWVT